MHCHINVPASNRFSIASTSEEEFFKAVECIVPNIEYQSALNYAVMYVHYTCFHTAHMYNMENKVMYDVWVPLIPPMHHTLNHPNLDDLSKWKKSSKFG